MKNLFSVFSIGLVCAGLLGCQTQNASQTGVLAASTQATNQMSSGDWLMMSNMPRFEDRTLDAVDAAYALRKLGYDPSPAEVARWIGVDRSAFIDQILAELNTAPVVPVPSWTTLSPRYWGQQGWSAAEKRSFRAARTQEVGELRQWWIRQMLATPSPLGERLVMFWENTFVAGYSGLNERSHAQWQHHNTIRSHATGNYGDLVRAMVRDPAVLIYLDNTRNKKNAPNENLARELFELFTLGEGHYSERDVKEAARALAGWHISEYGQIQFQEKDWARDYGTKTIFGRSGDFDGDDLVNLILSHPAASQYVAKRFWKEFVSADSAPPRVIADWSDGFIRTGMNIKEFMRIVLNSASFWDERYRATSVKSPVELVIGSLRSAQSEQLSLPVIDASLTALGQTLLDPPDVSGWGDGTYWLEPNLLIERERVLADIAKTLTQEKPVKRVQPRANTIENLNKTLTLRLAGEAYKGNPGYRVTVKHQGGTWYSDSMTLASARDTERLGRYKSPAEWVWETVQLPLPERITDIQSVSVYFGPDAAGSGGDRNLFIGSIQWQGQAYPASLGVQSPGCGNNRGAIRQPGRLYCQGSLTLDIASLQNSLKAKGGSHTGRSNDLLSKELVLLNIDRPKKKGYQAIDLMFDELETANRKWDYFGFQLARDRKGRFTLQVDEDRCHPACFERWPSKAWVDKSGLRHVSIHLKYYTSWSREHFYGLSADDQALIRKLISLVPGIRDRVNASPLHKNDTSKALWQERMSDIVELADALQWRLDQPPQLIETVDRSPESNSANRMMSMGAMATGGDSRYHIFGGAVENENQWFKNLEQHLVLASEPLESWMLSAHEGERLTDLSAVVTSPYRNLK